MTTQNEEVSVIDSTSMETYWVKVPIDSGESHYITFTSEKGLNLRTILEKFRDAVGLWGISSHFASDFLAVESGVTLLDLKILEWQDDFDRLRPFLEKQKIFGFRFWDGMLYDPDIWNDDTLLTPTYASDN